MFGDQMPFGFRTFQQSDRLIPIRIPSVDTDCSKESRLQQGKQIASTKEEKYSPVRLDLQALRAVPNLPLDGPHDHGNVFGNDELL